MSNLGAKYLVWGYYGYGNLGDELMLRTIVENIRSVRPDAEIRVKCFNTPSVKGVILFPADKNLSRIPVIKHVIYMSKVLAELVKVDSLVIGGGTLFLDKGRFNTSILYLCKTVFMAKLFRKKVYMTGVGIDIMAHPANLFFLRFILRRCDYLALRDDFSYTLATYLRKDRVAVRSSDIIFDSGSVDTLTAGSGRGKENIIVSLSDYFVTWGSSEERRAMEERSRAMITSLLQRYAGRYRIILCAFQKSIGERDYEFLSSLKDSIIKDAGDYHDRITVEYLREDTVGKIFGNAAFIIGMRYHALVLSAIFRKPFLGINMESKIKEICVDLKMPFVAIKEFMDNGISEKMFGGLESACINEDDLKKCIAYSAVNFGWLGTN